VTRLNLAVETVKLLEEDGMGVKIYYYQSWLCSCVGLNNGVYDPNCGCTFGYYYKDPVEYEVLRTSIDFRRIQHKLGEILQGGCTMSIPKLRRNSHAYYVGQKDLSAGIDLSGDKNIKISIDGSAEQTVDLSSEAVSAADTKIYEIIRALNGAGLGEIALETDINGNPSGNNYLSIRSTTIGSGAKVEIYHGATLDALPEVFNVTEPILVKPANDRYDHLPIWSTISRGDVVVVDDRVRREGDILRRDSRDIINAFNVQKIHSITNQNTQYYEGVDYTISGRTITWKAGKGVASAADYAAEFSSKINYIVVDDLAADRGSDTDIMPKKIHVALRSFANDQPLPID